MSYEKLGAGATAVGIKVKDGVILAAEKRVSYGGYILSRVGKKVFSIKDRFGMACAGLFADMQTLSRLISAEISYYEINTGKTMTVKSAAKLLAVILYSYKYFPFFSEILFGGIDEEGPHLFVMDPIGSLIEDDYAAIGTGGAIAIGIIEGGYRKDLSLEETEKLAVKAVKAAISRDAVSGDGVDTLTISKSGAKENFYPV